MLQRELTQGSLDRFSTWRNARYQCIRRMPQTHFGRLYPFSVEVTDPVRLTLIVQESRQVML